MLKQKEGQFWGKTLRQETSDGLILSENRYSPDQATPRHTHEATLFYFVRGGICREKITRDSAHHLPSTTIFLPPGEPHSTHWLADEQGICFHLEITESYRNTHLRLRRPLESSLPSRGIHASTESNLSMLMQRLHTELAQWDDFSPLVTQGLILELLGNFARLNSTGDLISDFSQTNLTNDVSKDRPSRWLAMVEEYLRDTLAQPLDLVELADMAGVHPSHLVRAFRQRYDTTPGEFVRRLRIEEACHRIAQNREISLSELAIDLGFADQSHFSRLFRQYTGYSPALYRRSIHP